MEANCGGRDRWTMWCGTRSTRRKTNGDKQGKEKVNTPRRNRGKEKLTRVCLTVGQDAGRTESCHTVTVDSLHCLGPRWPVQCILTLGL